ncbi:MAG TPA: ABC transporter substrate-binding protein [Sulfolobales archaeon]|nr:ABC transporter substrate-binding protein [Sulfolobales archaeon]
MTTADPSTEFSNSIMWMAVVYERLLMYDPLQNKFIPELAVKWERGPDNLTWTFYLRKDAKFHDGVPVNADAVIFSITRTKELGMGAAFLWDSVDWIEKVDDYTIRFHLKYPAPLDLIASASYGVYIFSPKVVEYAKVSNATDPKVAEWFNAGHDAGSGPYKLVKWDPENEVILEKFDEWWGWKDPSYQLKSDKAPQVFIIKIVKDAVAQERMLLAGEIDIAYQVPLEDLDSLKANPNVVVVTKPSFQQLILLLNTKKPPLDNVLVRRAIAYAIPYDDIVKIARSGMARVASGPVPYGMWGHDENLRFEYNLDKAKSLLAQAGYPQGLPRPLVLTYTAGDIYEKRTAELIQSSLAKIGITVDVRPLSWEEQWAIAKKGWEDPNAAQDILMFYWWPTYISPFDFIYNMFNSESKAFNLAYYTNKEFDNILAEAVTLEGSDRAKATQLYIMVQEILHKDVPGIPLWDMVDVRVASAKIKNLDKAINPAYPTVIFPQVLEVGG